MSGAKTIFSALTGLLFSAVRHEPVRPEPGAAARVHGFEHLRGHRYAVLTTFRKDGSPVPTAVWFGLDTAGCVYFVTEANAYKVRRIRRADAVLLAPSDLRGRPVGPAAAGTARVLPAAEIARAERVIAANYGLIRPLYRAFSARLSAGQVYVEVKPGAAERVSGK